MSWFMKPWPCLERDTISSTSSCRASSGLPLCASTTVDAIPRSIAWRASATSRRKSRLPASDSEARNTRVSTMGSRDMLPTKLPDPCLTPTMSRASSLRSASLTDERETPRSAASAASVGRGSPGARLLERICALTAFIVAADRFKVLIGAGCGTATLDNNSATDCCKYLSDIL